MKFCQHTSAPTCSAKTQTDDFNALLSWNRDRAALAAQPTDRAPIRVLVADDHPIVRQGLTYCLAQTEAIRVIAEAEDGNGAVLMAKAHQPDLVLMDIVMRRMNGLAATSILRKACPSVKVLILSMHNDPHLVPQILHSGARGYVLKRTSTDTLIEAIKVVAAGGTFFSPEFAQAAVSLVVQVKATGLNLISEREREVLVAVAEGLSNKETASLLGLGVRTIESHRQRLMRKLNVHSVAGLTQIAVSNGLLGMPVQAFDQPPVESCPGL
jgi:DNA-binding NarL/FixJ family response regulator